MDAQLVARRLNVAFSNDDLWTSPSIVDEVEDLADEYDALKAENASLRGAAKGLGELCDRYKAENANLRVERDEWHRVAVSKQDTIDHMRNAMAENAKLREQLERLQPKDSEGNVLDIADTVHMLRSEFDGDHEWDDVVVELTLTKWGMDRWIVCGSRGEAWACDCTKTGYDEDAYENSDDAELVENPTLIEVENVKLRKLVNSYADLFEMEAAKNNGHGPYYSGEDWLALANDMRVELAKCCGELGIERRTNE